MTTIYRKGFLSLVFLPCIALGIFAAALALSQVFAQDGAETAADVYLFIFSPVAIFLVLFVSVLVWYQNCAVIADDHVSIRGMNFLFRARDVSIAGSDIKDVRSSRRRWFPGVGDVVLMTRDGEQVKFTNLPEPERFCREVRAVFCR